MTLKVMQNRSRTSVSGRYPIVIQVIINRKRTLIYTGIKVYPEEFNDQKGCVRYTKGISISRRETLEMNKKIDKILKRLTTFIYVERKKNPKITPKELGILYRRQLKENTLFSMFEKMIKEKYASGKIGAAKSYESTYRKFRELTNNADIKIDSMTPEDIYTFNKMFKEQNLTPNTISFYFRNLKAAINLYRKNGPYDPFTKQLFQGISTTSKKTSKRSLTIEEVQKIIAFNPGEDESLSFAKDLFLLCFMLRGLALVDIYYMKKNCLKGGYIRLRRHKTEVLITIALTPETSILIERYKSQTKDSPYLFYFLDEYPDAGEAYRAYRSALKQQNRALSKIGKKIGLTINLTSYVARHAWATQAKLSGAPVEHISEAMGHTSQRTTYIYLKNYEQDTIDSLNNAVVQPYLKTFRKVYSADTKQIHDMKVQMGV